MISFAKAAIIIPSSTLTGMVTDNSTGLGIVGADLDLVLRYSPDDECDPGDILENGWCYQVINQTTSLSDGSYLMDGIFMCGTPPPGLYLDLRVVADGYSQQIIESLDIPCFGMSLQDVSLEPDIPGWRQDIQIGDLLYDEFASGVGHIGVYVGDGRVVEAQGIPFPKQDNPGQVNNNPITEWDYPKRDTVYLLRVKKPAGMSDPDWLVLRQNVADFVKSQNEPTAKPYDWSWTKKQLSSDSPSWYCSELAWAAYFNQGIDLEYQSGNTPIPIPTPLPGPPIILNASPVSPVEIFRDEDTYVVNYHMEGQDSVPLYKRFAPLLVLSPVEVTVTDPDGNVMDINNMGIPGATFIQDEVDSTGHSYDALYLPYVDGDYQVTVVRKPGAGDGEAYSLKISFNGQTVWLTKDHLVPDTGSSHNYSFDLSEFRSESRFGYWDSEDSSPNVLESSSLDISLSSTSDFSPKLGSGQNSNRSIALDNTGQTDVQYTFAYDSGSGDLCAHLDADVYLNGTPIYSGALSGITFGSSLLTVGSDDTIGIELSLTSSSSSIWNKDCDFDLLATAWQTDLPGPTSGFSDKVIISSHAESSAWGVVLNEFLPNPHGEEYGFDFGQDSSDMPQGEWVELYNNGSSPQDLSGWYIRDDTDTGSHKILITATNTQPATTTIAANSWLVVYMNKALLNNGGDNVRLFDSSDILIDSYEYKVCEYEDLEPTPGDTNSEAGTGSCTGMVPGNKSYARIPDGTGDWVDPVPTPGQTNLLDSPDSYRSDTSYKAYNKEDGQLEIFVSPIPATTTPSTTHDFVYTTSTASSTIIIENPVIESPTSTASSSPEGLPPPDEVLTPEPEPEIPEVEIKNEQPQDIPDEIKPEDPDSEPGPDPPPENENPDEEP